MPFKDLGEGIALESVLKALHLELERKPQIKLKTLCPLEEAGPGAICFTRRSAPAQLLQQITSNKPSVVLIPKDLQLDLSTVPKESIVIPVQNPFQSVLSLLPLFFSPHPPIQGISTKADIDPSVKIGKNVRIGAFCSIGALVEIADNVTIHASVTIYPGVKIGDGSVVHSGAVIREDCVLGSESVIQNGAIIGADGFGFLPDGKGGIIKVPQVGYVELGQNVEIGANSCVDRATLGKTQISESSKIDNLVQIGHNAKIGRASIICGQVGLAGSVNIGNNVIIGGGAGVADHRSIADGCRIGALAGVSSDLDQPGDYAGYPAMPASLWRRQVTFLARLAKESRRRKIEKKKKLND